MKKELKAQAVCINMTKISFRKDNDGEIIAVFLNEINHHSKLELVCYAHMGQHGGCSIGWLYETRPAKSSEYKSLLNELIHSIGYEDLEIQDRLPPYSKTVQIIANEQRKLDDK